MNLNNNEFKKKLKILNQTKSIVKIDGWSEKILNKLIQQGINNSDLFIFFKNDYKELLKFSIEELNILLENKIKKLNIINLPLNKRIKKILVNRIDILNKDKIFYKKTLNHLLLPQNLNILKKNLYKSVDNMWYLAGDNSTDFNFYTKRIILAAIYINALLIFFRKDSYEAELNIDDNLKKISKIPKLKNRFSFLRDNLPMFIKGIFN